METSLLRFDGYYFESPPPVGLPPVPLTGAVLSVTRQGATVTQMVAFLEQETHDIGVADAGAIEVGDLLALEFYEDVQLFVVAVSSDRRTLTLQNYGVYIAPAPGQRLMPTEGRPALFRDFCGADPFGASVPTVNAAGFVFFFAASERVDVVVSGGTLTSPRLLIDQLGHRVHHSGLGLDARGFPSIQTAIDSLPPHGGTVFIPAGFHDNTETLYTPCDRPCHLLGEGASFLGTAGTVLRWSVNTAMLRIRGSNSSVRGITLRMDASGTAASEHEGYGIQIGRRAVVDAHPHPGTSATDTEYDKAGRAPLHSVVLEDVTVLNAPGWGLLIPGWGTQADGAPEHGLVAPTGNEGGTIAFWVTANRVRVGGSRKYGALFAGQGCTTLRFTDGACLWQGDGQTDSPACYALLKGVLQPTFRDWTFEGTSPVGNAAGTSGSWVKLVGCEGVNFDTCWFENDIHWDAQGQGISQGYTAQYFVHLSGRNRSVSLRNPIFGRGGKGQGRLRCVYCDVDGVQGLNIDQPYAFSSTALTSTVPGEIGFYEPIDNRAFVLNGENNPANGNSDIVVTGSGLAIDNSIDPGSSDLFRWKLPLTMWAVPAGAHQLGRVALRVPSSSQADRTNSNPRFNDLFSEPGAMAVEELAAGQANSHSLLFCSGDKDNWRLANNLPLLNQEQRDARDGWVDGDMVIENSAASVPQVFIGGVWKFANNVPTLTHEQRDARTGWIQGDMIINSSGPQLQMYVEGHWRTVFTFP